jgi:glutamyl/glutaminyl-tRNA synthetase
MDMVLAFYAGIAAVDETVKKMERRVRSIPGGWRDLRLVQSKLEKLGDNLMLTIPPEKLRNLKKMAKRSRFHIVLGPQATQTAKADEALLGFDDLDVYRGTLEVPALEKELEEYIKMRGYPMGKVMNSLRLALTGSASGLGIAAIISLIGRKEFARRMTYIANRLGRI